MKASIDTRIQSAVLTETDSGGNASCVIEKISPLTSHAADDDARLRAQLQELECVYQTTPIGLGLIDREFRYMRVNECLAAINGRAVEDHIGKTIREVLGSLADQAEALCRRVLSTGQPILDVEFEGESPAEPGVVRVWNTSWSPIKNSRGEGAGVNVTIEDVTARKGVERALAEAARVKDALYRLTDCMHRAKSLHDIYDAALSAIVDALRCDRASILLYDETGVMRFVGWRDLSDDYRRAVEGHSPWDRDDPNPEPVCVENVVLADLADELKATVVGEGIHACAFIPLLAQGRLLGKFMAYFNAPHEFRTDELNLCWSIARQLAFGIEHQRSLAALREREHHFREMIDALPAAIYTTDAEGRVLHFNPAAVQLAGRVPEIGRDHWCVSWKLFRPDGTELAHDECPMAVSLKKGEMIRGVEAMLERPDGTRRWFEPYPTPLRDAIGRVVGGINMLVDITDRKLAEESLREHARRLALISDTAPVYIAHCDAQGRFKLVNRAYADRFGLQPSDCVGKHISEVVGATAYQAFRHYVEVALRGQPVQFDVAIPYSSLEERFMHCSYAPERDADGNVIGFVAAITDITERRRIEQALRTSEEKLKETDRRKDEFLAMLAHELRNPLSPIANAAQLLRMERNGSEVVQQARAIIERQTGRLARLVDDLLEVSRITTGRIRLLMESIAMGGIIERAIETVRPIVEQHRHSFSVSLPDSPLWLYGDAARLEQVVVNLLTNAVKYTDDGGRIELVVESEGREVVLRVRDSGIGISPDLLPHVFDLFTQSERSLDRSHGGLGIGLSLVQRLVSMHGGSVHAHSVVGEGSEFTVRLPMAPPPQQSASADENSSATASGLKILVVDDNIDAARSLAMLLELSGHTVSTAHDGLEAVAAADLHQPQLVFLDIGLPKLDGYSVAERIRKSGLQAMLVALTGYGQAADRERARKAGFDRHLVKPVEFASVERILAEAGAHPDK